MQKGANQGFSILRFLHLEIWKTAPYPGKNFKAIVIKSLFKNSLGDSQAALIAHKYKSAHQYICVVQPTYFLHQPDIAATAASY